MWTFDLFFDRLGDLDWLAVLVGTVVVWVVAYLWYGPIFGKAWARATGIQMENPSPPQFVQTVLYLLVFNIGIAYLGAIDDIEHSIVLAIIVAVLVVAPALYSGVVWNKHTNASFLINGGWWLAAAAVASYVQGLVA